MDTGCKVMNLIGWLTETAGYNSYSDRYRVIGDKAERQCQAYYVESVGRELFLTVEGAVRVRLDGSKGFAVSERPSLSG
jgi:hypothetical protein